MQITCEIDQLVHRIYFFIHISHNDAAFGLKTSLSTWQFLCHIKCFVCFDFWIYDVQGWNCYNTSTLLCSTLSSSSSRTKGGSVFYSSWCNHSLLTQKVFFEKCNAFVPLDMRELKDVPWENNDKPKQKGRVSHNNDQGKIIF